MPIFIDFEREDVGEVAKICASLIGAVNSLVTSKGKLRQMFMSDTEWNLVKKECDRNNIPYKII